MIFCTFVVNCGNMKSWSHISAVQYKHVNVLCVLSLNIKIKIQAYFKKKLYCILTLVQHSYNFKAHIFFHAELNPPKH